MPTDRHAGISSCLVEIRTHTGRARTHECVGLAEMNPQPQRLRDFSIASRQNGFNHFCGGEPELFGQARIRRGRPKAVHADAQALAPHN